MVHNARLIRQRFGRVGLLVAISAAAGLVVAGVIMLLVMA